MSARLTEFGFDWGAAQVTRICSDSSKGWVTIGIQTPRHKRPVEVYVTRTGKVRVFSTDGEWKPVKAKA